MSWLLDKPNLRTITSPLYYRINQLALHIVVLVLIIIFLLSSTGILQCPVLRHTGSPCCTCGITRDVSAILSGNIYNLINPMSLHLVIWIAIQVVYRVLLLYSGRNTEISRTWIKLDLFTTFGSLILIAVYFCS